MLSLSYVVSSFGGELLVSLQSTSRPHSLSVYLLRLCQVARIMTKLKTAAGRMFANVVVALSSFSSCASDAVLRCRTASNGPMRPSETSHPLYIFFAICLSE